MLFMRVLSGGRQDSRPKDASKQSNNYKQFYLFFAQGSSTLQQKDCREISAWTGAYDLVANEPWWDSDLSQALVNGVPSPACYSAFDLCFLSDMMWVKAIQDEGDSPHSSYISLSFVFITPAWAWFGHAGLVLWLKAEHRLVPQNVLGDKRCIREGAVRAEDSVYTNSVLCCSAHAVGFTSLSARFWHGKTVSFFFF